MSNTVFLSYAREDSDSAQRLVADLRARGISVWFDRDSLTPGQVWKEEIERVIRESDFFLALLSSNSVDKRGFVQAELATAKSVLDEIPHGRIYLIPARLDNCNVDPRLGAHHWADLFPDWNAGVSQILKAIGYPEAEEFAKAVEKPTPSPAVAQDLGTARRAVLSAWDPLYIALPLKDRENLEQLWSEVRGVEAIGAWQALSALAGQLIEALLKERLVIDGHYQIAELSTKTLGALVRRARTVGLFPDYGDNPTGASAVIAARTLRNWASHSSLWYDYPTERRASQSLVLTVCIVEALFPRTIPIFEDAPGQDDDQWFLQNMQNAKPGRILSHLEEAPKGALARAVQQSPGEFYRHVLRYGNSSSVAKLLEVSYKPLELDQDLLRTAVAENFSRIVGNASRSSFKSFPDVLWRLRALGLETYATLFSILLPFDVDLLIKLLKSRAGAWVARYVNESLRAEPRVYAATALNPERRRELVTAFWQAFGDHSGNILNMANILGTLPFDVRAEILQQPEASVVATWVSASEPRNAVNLLHSLSDRIIALYPGLEDVRQSVLTALTRQIQRRSPKNLHELPLRLAKFKMTTDSGSVKVLREVLHISERRGHPSSEWPQIRRIVWDCYALIEPLRSEAYEVALGLLQDANDIPTWEALCLAGLVDLEEQQSSSVGSLPVDNGEFLGRVSDPNTDRFQRFLAALGYWRLCRVRGMQFPESARVILSGLLRETREPYYGPSKRLLDRIGALLGNLNDATRWVA